MRQFAIFGLLLACETAQEMVSTPTYYRDVAPILDASCTSCHREGGIGPMAFTTYQDARRYASGIGSSALSGSMPPWHADDTDCHPLENPQVLSDADKMTLFRWAAMGAAEGNPADYLARAPRSSRPLPVVADLIARASSPYEPQLAGQDDYRCFVIDPQLGVDRDVVGVRVRPGYEPIVHHVLLYEVRANSLAQLSALDEAAVGEGYPCFGGPGVDLQSSPNPLTGASEYNLQGIGGWAPGSAPTYFPEGTAIRLHSGSRLVLQLHYSSHNSINAVQDQTSVELFFAEAPVAQPATWSAIYNANFRIPIGADPDTSEATVKATTSLARSARLLGIAPHMHLLGAKIRVDVIRANGERECLINIPRWDFHWQRTYWFREAIPIAASATAHDTLELTCVFDNRANHQPDQRTPRPLIWGESSNDEMCLSFLYLAP